MLRFRACAVSTSHPLSTSAWSLSNRLPMQRSVVSASGESIRPEMGAVFKSPPSTTPYFLLLFSVLRLTLIPSSARSFSHISSHIFMGMDACCFYTWQNHLTYSNDLPADSLNTLTLSPLSLYSFRYFLLLSLSVSGPV